MIYAFVMLFAEDTLVEVEQIIGKLFLEVFHSNDTLMRQ